jgi:hypothetical protein
VADAMDRLRELMGQAGLPTPERIAAALALAEACEARAKALNYIERGTAEHHIWNVAFPAYRATAPKPLRTRAEVDADLAACARLWVSEKNVEVNVQNWRRMQALCSEPLAPDPADTGACPPECPECPQPYGPSSVDSSVPPPEPAAGATLSDVEACSCEESEALKAHIEAILSHVVIVNGTSYRVRDLLAVKPLVAEALK